MGERAFQIVYSVVAIATLVMVVQAWRSMPPEPPLWAVDDPLWALASLIVLVARILFMGSLVGNPALPAPGDAVTAQREPRGVFAITRHPLMLGFSSWDLTSEDRRVGKDCISACRYRLSPYHQQKHTYQTNNSH